VKIERASSVNGRGSGGGCEDRKGFVRKRKGEWGAAVKIERASSVNGRESGVVS